MEIKSFYFKCAMLKYPSYILLRIKVGMTSAFYDREHT